MYNIYICPGATYICPGTIYICPGANPQSTCSRTRLFTLLMAAGAALVCFGVPSLDGICGQDGTAGDLCGVFVVAAGAAGCDGVAGATGAAGAAGGLAVNNTGEASGVAGATTGVVDVSSLTASG